jgi:hypothetical protein
MVGIEPNIGADVQETIALRWIDPRTQEFDLLALIGGGREKEFLKVLR